MTKHSRHTRYIHHKINTKNYHLIKAPCTKQRSTLRPQQYASPFCICVNWKQQNSFYITLKTVNYKK